MSLRPVLIASLMSLGLAACAATPAPSTDIASPNPLMAQGAWTLNAVTAADGTPLLHANAYQLRFTDGRVSVQGGCNQMSGDYAMTDGRLQIGALASTRKACPEPLMQQDAILARLLAQPLTVSLRESNPELLNLETPARDTLMFSLEPSSESRYGGPGKTVFLEVAPQTAPCHHPLIQDMQCLQVREVKYDDKGLKVGAPGEFENFYSSIDGYAHEDGVRNVLRVNRYTIKDPPADASSVAYVLDMVVESDASAK